VDEIGRAVWRTMEGRSARARGVAGMVLLGDMLRRFNVDNINRIPLKKRRGAQMEFIDRRRRTKFMILIKRKDVTKKETWLSVLLSLEMRRNKIHTI